MPGSERSKENNVVCPESTIESASRRNYVDQPAPKQSGGKNNKLVCESTIDSAPRRDFIRKAALVTATAGIGGVLLGKNVIPQSYAIDRVVCCYIVARNSVAVDAIWAVCCCPQSAPNNGSSLLPGIVFGCRTGGEGISSARTCGAPNKDGIDFWTDFGKRVSITNCGRVGIGTSAPESTLEVQGCVPVEGQSLLHNGCAVAFEAASDTSIGVIRSSYIRTWPARKIPKFSHGPVQELLELWMPYRLDSVRNWRHNTS